MQGMQGAATWIASIFGPLLVIVGIWTLIYADHLIKVLNNFKSSPGIMYFSSIVHLLVGFAVLSQYDLWAWNAFVMVTILGWFMVVRGIMGLFVPQLLMDFYMGNPHFTRVWGVVPLVWGLGLCWIGFFM